MFRLLRKSLQAPHPTLIAALSLCCHLSSWFKSLSPIWTLPSCLLRCRICSLSISHSLQIVVSLVTPCALMHTLAHGQGTLQSLLLTHAPLTLPSRLTQHPVSTCLGEGIGLFLWTHQSLCSIHIDICWSSNSSCCCTSLTPHKLFPLLGIHPNLLPPLTHTTLPNVCIH